MSEKGPFGEPYCDAECKRQAGEALNSWFQTQEPGQKLGSCKICGEPVDLGDEGRAVMAQLTSQAPNQKRTVTIWLFCSEHGKRDSMLRYTQPMQECAWCGKRAQGKGTRQKAGLTMPLAKLAVALLIVVVVVLCLYWFMPLPTPPE